ncbi:MAG: hypothetical protein HY298_06735 [Verrucomicrobia bacterium]|nr:hypothetical protein [Verrucomicrobiota bacterium]
MRTQLILSLACLLCGCADMPSSRVRLPTEELVGAWRSKVQFTTGAFAAVKDLEFMYVFNAGGTMTESSNYDGAPPVPPAYGVWKKVGPRQFQAKYVFYSTKPPANFDEVSKGGRLAASGARSFNRGDGLVRGREILPVAHPL